MSIYIFKTENFYGGETRVFTNKIHAVEHLENFIKSTDGKIDAVIEEHKPVYRQPSKDDWVLTLNLVREDGWDKPVENVTWEPTNPIY